ncbi:MAG: hypothetical protein JW986_05855 [Methanotrichaceae archaeon]|nr:hypothetical protein [Methanotrichaceae archaeon]
MARQEKLRRYVSPPYGGLFGDSNLVNVLEQVIADPCIEFRPIDLSHLTKESPPTVRKSLKILTSLGILIKDTTNARHPVYRVNLSSKRYLALSFLAYAVLDDKLGTDVMDKVIADYCDSVLREKYAASHECLIPIDLGQLSMEKLDLSYIAQIETMPKDYVAPPSERVMIYQDRQADAEKLVIRPPKLQVATA